MHLNFTKKGLDALNPTTKRLVYHDTHAHGLCLRIEPSGRKSFCWFRKVNGRPTWKHIGKFPDLSIENARTKAAEYNSTFAKWKSDSYDGPNPFEHRRDLTLGDVLENYIERRIKTHTKNPDRAAKAVRWQFDKYVAAWRNRRLGTIRDQDIATLHHSLGDKQTTANRTVQHLRTLFNWARDEMHWSGENPVKRKFKFFAEQSSERFLQAEELQRLFTALSTEPSADLRDFIILALFTGARRNDVLSMRWENINFETTTCRIPNPKSRKPYIVPLMPEAVDILTSRKSSAKTEWVFPGRGKTEHVTGFKHSWPALLKRAAIVERFRVHDLRHTFASWQVASGASLPIIGASLGHHSSAMTERYAKLNVDPVRRAVELATRAMLLAAEPKKEEPKRLPRPRRRA